MIIWEITYYRRVMNGWELVSNRLLRDESEAIKILKFGGYKLLDDEENLYSGNSGRATLIEREVE